MASSIAPIPREGPSNATSARAPTPDAEVALRQLDGDERCLASLCALLAGPAAEQLVEGLVRLRREPMRAAVRALAALDRRRKLAHLAAESLKRTPGQVARQGALPARLAAVLALNLEGPERWNLHERRGEAPSDKQARHCHPALRAWIVRRSTQAV